MCFCALDGFGCTYVIATGSVCVRAVVMLGHMYIILA